MQQDFETYITAHIAKLIKAKHLDETAENKQQLINGIINNIICEVYPIALNYVDTLFD